MAENETRPEQDVTNEEHRGEGGKSHPRSRRPRGGRNRGGKKRDQNTMTAETMEPAAEDAALLSESASEAPEADTETVSEGSDAPKKGTRQKRSRGRRGGRNRHGKGGDRVPDNTPAAEEDFDAEDAESASEIIYEPTERDEIAAEVHELISEERLAALAEDDAENPEDDEAADESEADGDAEPAEPEAAVKSPVEIVGIRFKPAGKVYYFDPDGAIYRENDEVIVETARGIEFGFVVTANRTVIASDIVSPLKKILRMATEEDRAHYEENNRRRDEAFAVCREKIIEHGIDMKLIDVEYTFDNNKLLFYFTADGRVDFRELVKDLASVFRTRIELRQIGIRDEAKLMGGLGVCGRPFCCHSFLSDFVQVSIKMAKEQNLSLNSAKISGTCGRLMCCLRYEYDVYEEEIRKTPKMDAVVETPDGEAVVCEVIPLAGLVRVKFMGNRSDMPPKLFHRDDVRVKGKMNWKSGTVTYLEEQK